MDYQIDSSRIQSLVKELARVLDGKSVENIYVIMACAEMAGRVIVNCAVTSKEADELRHYAKEHLDRTVVVGAQAMQKAHIAPTEFGRQFLS